MLGKVGILILIDKHIAEMIAEVLKHIGIVAHQHIGIVQQVIEIHRSGNTASVAIDLENLIYPSTAAIGITAHKLTVGGIVLGRIQIVLRLRDSAKHLSGSVQFVIQL